MIDLLNKLTATIRIIPVLLLCLCTLLPTPLFAAIIADHTTTDLGAIPENWINLAKNNLRLSYGHTSHGSQPVQGMRVLAANPQYGNLYDLNLNGAIEDGVLSLDDYTPEGDLGSNGDTSWAAATRTYLDNDTGTGPSRNVVVWSWCSGVSYNSEEGIDTYLNTMNQLEQEYPDVTFVYMTGHLDGTGESGRLHRLNNRIRSFCQANNKVLFDFADIESFDPDGNYFLDRGADDTCNYDGGGNWATEWCGANSGSELCAEVSYCAHSEPLNCNLKARAFWWMLAKIAGWSEDITAPILSQGKPSGQLPAGSDEVTLSLSSDETANCRYSTEAGIDYSTMTNTFSSTDSTTHQHKVSNLEDGQDYDFFVRCQDSSGNSNRDDFVISFAIGSDIDDTAPVLSQGKPSGLLPAGTGEVALSLLSDETANCRYSTEAGVDYSTMIKTFSSTDSTTHRHKVSNLEDGHGYDFFIRCQDSSGNSNQDDYGISFNIAEPGVKIPGVVLPPFMLLLETRQDPL